jgi:hypothetical protein
VSSLKERACQTAMLRGIGSLGAGFPDRCTQTPSRGRGQGLTVGQPAQDPRSGRGP